MIAASVFLSIDESMGLNRWWSRPQIEHMARIGCIKARRAWRCTEVTGVTAGT
jgi:hypothetical protein